MPNQVSDFAPGELVRVSPEGSYINPLWAGALAVVVGKPYRGEGQLWVPLRRLADGENGDIRAPRVEKPND